MCRQGRYVLTLAAVIVATVSAPAWPQPAPKYRASADHIVAIKAGLLFDAKSGNLLNNQVVLIRGDRISDVGGHLQIPAGAQVIDLSTATVLPGMIDTHVHLNTGGNTPAQRALTAMANAQTDLGGGLHDRARHGLARRVQYGRSA
jgi:hypothetical protein